MITDKVFAECNDYIRKNIDLVLIHGEAHSGKGVAAKILTDQHGFREVGFADCLKEIAIKYFDWPYDLIHVNGKRTPESRLFMQAIGEAGRLLSPDFWIRRLTIKIFETSTLSETENFCSGNFRFVISDLRYLNEAEWGKSVGGELWEIFRTGEFEKIEAGANHISETALSSFDKWDQIIVNDSDLTALATKIADIYT